MQDIRSNKGFSVIELMIVIVITGLLAAVAVPIYHKNVENAMRTEAIAGIAAIANELEIYYGEHGVYPISDRYRKVVGQNWNDIKPGELTGKYFADKKFRYRSYDGIEWRVRCGKSGVLEKNVWLDQSGTWKFDDDEDIPDDD